jgi:GH18 family chitinase
LVDSHSRVQLSAQQLSDLESLRASKPGLSVLLSLGGQTVHSNTFRAIVSRKDQLNNFTQSLNQLYQEKTIQGIELDWEWPLDSGDKKDKIKLIRYIRVSLTYTAQ